MEEARWGEEVLEEMDLAVVGVVVVSQASTVDGVTDVRAAVRCKTKLKLRSPYHPRNAE